MQDDTQKRTIITVGVIIVIVIVFIFGIILAIRTLGRIFSGVRAGGGTPTSTSFPVVVPDNNTNIQTTKNPTDQYTGNIRFAATVDSVIGVKAFTVRDTGIFKDGLLIITDNSIAPIGAKTVNEYLIHPGDRLLISGSVDQFDPNNFKRSFGENFPTVNLGDYNGKPFVDASELSRIQ